MNRKGWFTKVVDGVTIMKKGRFTVKYYIDENGELLVSVTNGVGRDTDDFRSVDLNEKIQKVEWAYNSPILVNDVTYYKSFYICDNVEGYVIYIFADKSEFFKVFKSVDEAIKYIDLNMER